MPLPALFGLKRIVNCHARLTAQNVVERFFRGGRGIPGSERVNNATVFGIRYGQTAVMKQRAFAKQMKFLDQLPVKAVQSAISGKAHE